MRKLAGIAVAVMVAGTVVGAAIAHGRPGHGKSGTPGVAAISASPTLAIGNVTSATCTGADGAYRIDRFRATGAIANGQLAGNVMLAVKWTMNTTKNDGYAVGRLAIRNADGSVRAVAAVEGVLEGNRLSGFLHGRFASETTRRALLGTFEATRNGSLAVKIGTNNAPGAAILFGGTGCQPA